MREIPRLPVGIHKEQMQEMGITKLLSGPLIQLLIGLKNRLTLQCLMKKISLILI